MTVTYPHTQALSSQTFTAPHELLSRRTTILADLYEFNIKHNADHPLFRFWDGTRNVDLTWGMMGQAFYKTARFIKSQVKLRGDEDVEEGKPPVVGILAASGTFRFRFPCISKYSILW